MSIAYVVKRYPRYSETFIVNEILAHEAAGLDLHIFALRPPSDTHYQDKISRVKAPVIYLAKPTQGRLHPGMPTTQPSAATFFWSELQATAEIIPDIWIRLEQARGERATTVYQALWLAQEIYQRGITHLHAHFASMATSVARLAAHFAGITYSFTAHAKDIFHDDVVPQDLSRKLKDASAIITVSDYNQAYLHHQYDVNAQGVTRIYNGMDLDELNYAFRTNRSEIPKILAVSRLVEKKGLSDLIAACQILRDQGRLFHCQIIGTGPLESALRSQLECLHLQDWVEILGPRPQGEVFAQMQQADLFVAPYVIASDGNRDGLPTVLLEAMALGTPCVATAVTGIPEIIRDRTTGLLVPQRDPVSLAQALDTLLGDPILRESIAQQARRLIEQDFDIHQNAAQLRSYFKDPQMTVSDLQEV
ncbi:glycosyltransferase family 4 protein [Lyngbya confervoides]|uniref:Glycosyltransferase family 4 protein n=1 Tax=Lyngbya confervoides BDU141951 TaxID=1574623 RepID=A0ABD4T6T1_9CYAN|nr:glycosyltransferase family 4 protein [Lyngbya confervoides]MCM1984471.1 glycosyltransferase family 4 protein [Lyngbya confervoides BDU141951]